MDAGEGNGGVSRHGEVICGGAIDKEAVWSTIVPLILSWDLDEETLSHESKLIIEQVDEISDEVSDESDRCFWRRRVGLCRPEHPAEPAWALSSSYEPSRLEPE